jgi:pimeloyl-ACP methyl ester carboxylesterase
MINNHLIFWLMIFSIIMAHQRKASAQNNPTVEEVTLSIEPGTLHGTLALPDKSGPVPVILFISGSGPTDRDGNTRLLPGNNNSLKMLADSLAQHGYASLRYDKRGVAASKEAVQSEDLLRFEDYVGDAVDWIKQLRQDERFSQIIVLGHSEGSLIGMLAAREAQTDAYISVAGMAQPADSLILEQLAPQPDFVKNEANTIISSLQEGRVVDSVSQTMFALFRPSVQPYLISWFKYQPAEIIQELTQPVLIVQGTTDLQVKVKEAQRLAQAQPEAKLAIINEMNHVLKTAPTDPQTNLAAYSNPDLPLSDGLVESITSL